MGFEKVQLRNSGKDSGLGMYARCGKNDSRRERGMGNIQNIRSLPVAWAAYVYLGELGNKG